MVRLSAREGWILSEKVGKPAKVAYDSEYTLRSFFAKSTELRSKKLNFMSTGDLQQKRINFLRRISQFISLKKYFLSMYMVALMATGMLAIRDLVLQGPTACLTLCPQGGLERT